MMVEETIGIKELTKEEKIREIKSKLKSCEADLNGIFRGNAAIEQKKQILEEKLKELEKQ
jgi:hypothetical protein